MARGGFRAEEGEQVFKALIVPPIAMAFSLFFGVLNALGLLNSALSVKIKSAITLRMIFAVALALVLALPLLFPLKLSVAMRLFISSHGWILRCRTWQVGLRMGSRYSAICLPHWACNGRSGRSERT